MIAREYTRRVEIWRTTVVADAYGGNTVTSAKIGTSWANVKTPKSYNKFMELGITDPMNTIIVKMRYRKDITYNAINIFLKYRDVKYIIQNTALNVDFNNTDIEIIATREGTESVTT